MEIRTDRSGVLIEQLTDSAELAKSRCAGMTDDEFFWEPVPDMWSLRPRDEAPTSAPFGPGAWVLDREFLDPFDAGPLTTIGWRVSHVLHGLAGRYEWTFGSRQIDPALLVDFIPTAADALEMLWAQVDLWCSGIEGLSAEQLDETGFGQYPWGLDPQLPFIGIVRWVNREFIHHMAEVSLLRDLYDRRQDLLQG